MPLPDSPALAATLHALHGESDGPIVAPALDEREFARVLALAPGVDPVISALGALAGRLPDLLTPAMCASPALHAAIASLIGTDAGARILPWWAAVAPAGWGATHTDALINAVQNKHCATWAVAALIGPCDASAAMLKRSDDIARAVRCWGMATPDHPTAWTNDLPPSERDRLLDALCTYPDNAEFCLPWLPTAHAKKSLHVRTGTAALPHWTPTFAHRLLLAPVMPMSCQRSSNAPNHMILLQ